ncbi:L-seryl-tRNA(Sec) selenium transferase [bacterium]|nr:L-seryl-tRNA(Sec) selenium transferase [bacterium]
MNEDPSEFQELLRSIPPVNDWLNEPAVAACVQAIGRERTVKALREILDGLRQRIRVGERPDVARFVAAALAERFGKNGSRGLRRVINATGILLHTGLGRAPLSEDALDAIRQTAAGYCDLELDLTTGQRGRRIDAVRDTLVSLTGAEAATVVNNNAAATILALKAMAAGREVIVSRGQLVEIGGGFRMPEIMAVSGAILKEVGTTNRTRLSDFEAAIGPQTAAILRVHTSNYAIVGFTQEPAAADLARLAHARGLVFIDDIGSGALSADDLPATRHDPTVAESVAIGADVILFSGDKLLGGPQCGIIAGSKACVSRVEADPLMRAFRVDKLTLAALGATLRSWYEPSIRNRRIPFWRMIAESIDSLERRAGELAAHLAQNGWNVQVRSSEAFAGGGSLPDEKIESRAVVLSSPWPKGVASVSELARKLRQGDPAVVGRVHEDAFWIDLRTVAAGEQGLLIEAVASVVQDGHDQESAG